MISGFTRKLPLLAMLATFGLVLSGASFAEDTQNNESDVDFLKRMIASLKHSERTSAKYEDMVEQVARQATINTMSTGNDPLERQNSRYGSQMRNTTGNRDSDYRRAEMRIRSTKNKAIKEREKLSEMQRSGAELKPKEREKIENTVMRLEREVEDFNRDMQLGRF